MTNRQHYSAIFSLSFVWIFSGLTSLFFAYDKGLQILLENGIGVSAATLLIISGAGWDIFVAIWLLSGHWLRYCCIMQVVTIATYTILLSYIDASFWLHPFGPLIKNIPMVVLIMLILPSGVARNAN